MGRYLKTKRKVIHFDDDQVTVTYHNLQRKHMGTFSEFMVKDSDGNVKMEFKDQISMFNNLGGTLEECVEKIEGITAADGTKVDDIHTILSDVYFMPLVSDIIAAVIDSSFLTGREVETVKKSPTVQKRVLTTDVGLKDSMTGA